MLLSAAIFPNEHILQPFSPPSRECRSEGAPVAILVVSKHLPTEYVRIYLVYGQPAAYRGIDMKYSFVALIPWFLPIEKSLHITIWY
jgi:hypothetical protein